MRSCYFKHIDISEECLKQQLRHFYKNEGDKVVKKSLLLALNLLMMTSLLGGCTPAKTEETIQSDKNTVEEEKLDEEVLQGNSVEHETENEPAANSMEQNDEESQGEEDVVRQEKIVEGYVLEAEGNTITVDLENPEGRNYPEEGLDCGVEFDIANAEKEVIPTSGYSENRECKIKTGVTVSITYYEENGKNIVTKISTDNDEKEMIVYISSGEIEEITEEAIKVHVREGDYSGESLVFDTSETSIPEEASVNSTVTVTYYLKENTYYALSFICSDL